MVRTYTVSADDNNLTLVDIFTSTDGSHNKLTTTYARIGPGNSIFGQWKSISMVEESSGEESFTIEAHGQAGITMTSSSSNRRTDLELDRKRYPDKDSKSTKAETMSGKRLDARHIQIEDQVDGKPDSVEDLTVSEDGKTLTYISTALKTSTAFTSVFDKK